MDGGERPAFETVVEEHSTKIYALACRLLGGPSGAEDLAQESFIRAFRSYGNFRQESSVETWLYRITVNTWKNTVRYEKRRQFWKNLPLFRTKEKPQEPQETGARDTDKTDTALTLERALKQLTPEDKALIALRDMDGKSYDEIAVILDLPLGTVKSRLSRARETLRKFLEGSL